MKKIILLSLTVLFTLGSYAQSKVGTIDVEFILGNMTAELQTVNDSLKAYDEELSVDLKQKMENYESKYKEIEAAQETMTDADKRTKGQELMQIENDIRQYRQNGQQLLQLRREQLLAPLYQKIGEALDAEAKANGYTQVLTVGSGAIGYADPSYDLTDAVMKRLGVTVKATTTE